MKKNKVAWAKVQPQVSQDNTPTTASPQRSELSSSPFQYLSRGPKGKNFPCLCTDPDVSAFLPLWVLLSQCPWAMIPSFSSWCLQPACWSPTVTVALSVLFTLRPLAQLLFLLLHIGILYQPSHLAISGCTSMSWVAERCFFLHMSYLCFSNLIAESLISISLYLYLYPHLYLSLDVSFTYLSFCLSVYLTI